jgi:hypothetical protein
MKHVSWKSLASERLGEIQKAVRDGTGSARERWRGRNPRMDIPAHRRKFSFAAAIHAKRFVRGVT